MVIDIAEFFAYLVGFECEPLNYVLWWVLGLVVLQHDESYSLPESLQGLMELGSSIGYGTFTIGHEEEVNGVIVKQHGLKMFYALHGFVGYSLVNKQIEATIEACLKKGFNLYWQLTGREPDVRTGLALTVAVELLFAGVGMAYDLRAANYNAEIDAIDKEIEDAKSDAEKASLEAQKDALKPKTIDTYWLAGLNMAIMAATTTGYGAVAPGTELGQLWSPLFGFLLSGTYDIMVNSDMDAEFGGLGGLTPSKMVTGWYEYLGTCAWELDQKDIKIHPEGGGGEITLDGQITNNGITIDDDMYEPNRWKNTNNLGLGDVDFNFNDGDNNRYAPDPLNDPLNENPDPENYKPIGYY